MTSPGSDEIKQRARSTFVYYLVLWIWKRVVYILIFGNVASALAIWLAPQSAKSGAAYRLMANISLPNSVIAGAFLLGAILLMFYRTSIAGHAVSFLALSWWTILVIYIAILLDEPTSLLAASWSGTLALLHVFAALARWMARSGSRNIQARVIEGGGGSTDVA